MPVAEKSARRHVLIVDDEWLIRWSMAETQAHAGYDISEARDAKETLLRLSMPPPPDVILLDYRLPDSNDMRLLETIRQTLPSTSVIMMTAYSTAEMVGDAIKLGVHRVVNKPVEMADLVPLIEQACGSRHH
jgi:DNA-binding NtrC family response regulator